MKASYLAEQFALGKSYAEYVAAGTPEQQKRWATVYDIAKITPVEHELLNGFTRQMNVLVISGIWCGDCVQQCPLQQRLAEGNPGKIQLRFLERDKHRELVEQVRINAGDRVPTTFFLAEDFELCGIFGDRTISRYRAMAKRQLGASCPIGLAAPEADEMAATTADWATEFERMQLLLRLSGRLRLKYGD